MFLIGERGDFFVYTPMQEVAVLALSANPKLFIGVWGFTFGLQRQF